VALCSSQVESRGTMQSLLLDVKPLLLQVSDNRHMAILSSHKENVLSIFISLLQ
jgi:hypothetical protein